jgi:opacity protein-like surface antigen
MRFPVERLPWSSTTKEIRMRHWPFPVALYLFMLVCALFAAGRLAAQTAPAASEGGLPLTIGAGLADDNIDFGADRRMAGIAVWVDWDLTGHKFVPKGLELEAEGRTIRFSKPQGFSQMREETFLGGVRYSWRHYPNFRPFAKGLMGIGSIDFPPYASGYGHDTRTVKAIGGGIEYRVHNSIWLRAEYEYQMWPDIFGGGTLTPNGATIGATYHFRHHTTFR